MPYDLRGDSDVFSKVVITLDEKCYATGLQDIRTKLTPLCSANKIQHEGMISIFAKIRLFSHAANSLIMTDERE